MTRAPTGRPSRPTRSTPASWRWAWAITACSARATSSATPTTWRRFSSAAWPSSRARCRPISHAPDFTADVDEPFNERSSLDQAWGTYGVLWPVVNRRLGVDPQLGNGLLEVLPNVPAGQSSVSGTNIRVGTGARRRTRSSARLGRGRGRRRDRSGRPFGCRLRRTVCRRGWRS